MAGIDNLIPVTQRSKEEAREMSRNGGIASGKTRRARKTFREALKAALSCSIPKSSPHYRNVKKMMEDFGIEGEPIVQDLPMLGMISRAAKDHNAFVAIRDTIGEKPTEQLEIDTPQSPLMLGMIPLEKVKAAKEAHEARQLSDRKEQ